MMFLPLRKRSTQDRVTLILLVSERVSETDTNCKRKPEVNSENGMIKNKQLYANCTVIQQPACHCTKNAKSMSLYKNGTLNICINRIKLRGSEAFNIFIFIF